MRRRPCCHQLSERAPGSALCKPRRGSRLRPPGVRVAGRARTGPGRLRGAGLLPPGPAPWGAGVPPPRLRAPARSPSWNWEEEGEGDREEIGAVVRAEPEAERRSGRGCGAHPQRPSLSCPPGEAGRRQGPGRERGLSPSDPGRERGRAAGRPSSGWAPSRWPQTRGSGPPVPSFWAWPLLLRSRGPAPQTAALRDPGPTLTKAGAASRRLCDPRASGPCVQRCPGSAPHAVKDQARSPPIQTSGVHTPRATTRDSAAVALEEVEDWTARSEQAVTPSPRGEASRARPSGRVARAQEEVARGEVSLPLSPLGRAAGGAQEEAEALGHHSDPYQARPHSQGP